MIEAANLHDHPQLKSLLMTLSDSSPTPDLLYEGKAKRVYRTADPQVVLCQYKDDATAFNAQKRGTILNKGEVNCTVAALLFQHLEKLQISTHFLEQISAREMRVKAVQILAVEVVVRNRAAGSLCKRLGLERGIRIDPPLVEFYYKRDDLGDPLVTLDHIQLLELATPDQVQVLRDQALQVNYHLRQFFLRCDLELIDFKLEFGLDQTQQILLADEISPDTCRLWDLQDQTKEQRVLDKDLFRFDLGDPVAGYQEVLQRVKQAIAGG